RGVFALKLTKNLESQPFWGWLFVYRAEGCLPRSELPRSSGGITLRFSRFTVALFRHPLRGLGCSIRGKHRSAQSTNGVRARPGGTGRLLVAPYLSSILSVTRPDRRTLFEQNRIDDHTRCSQVQPEHE